MTPYYSVLPLFLFSCLNAEAFAQGIRALPTVNGTDANLSQIYNGAVSSKSLDMYLYSYREMTNQIQLVVENSADPGEMPQTAAFHLDLRCKSTGLWTTAVRISAESNNSNIDYPTIFVVRQERSVLSWQIPLLLQYTWCDTAFRQILMVSLQPCNYQLGKTIVHGIKFDGKAVMFQFPSVSRTLCPLDTHSIVPSSLEQTFYIEISTLSKTNIQYSMKAEILTDFEIKTNQHKVVTSSPSEPVYYLYTFTKGIDTVVVTAMSENEHCMTLSVQNVKCPVFDMNKDVEYQGSYQTMTKQGAITVNRHTFSDSFYIILVVKPNDQECTSIQTIHPAGINIRRKNVTLHVKETVPTFQYYKATLAAVGFFCAFYVVAVMIGCFYHGCKKNWGIIDLSDFDRSTAESSGIENTAVKTPLRGIAGSARSYGAVPDSIASEISQELRSGRPSYVDSDDNISEDSLTDYDLLNDADRDKNIFRTKTALYVVDLARKSEKRQAKRYKLYTTNLFTISVFYGLPVLQLVFTYQKVLNATGDQDICYYNFACAHPLGRVSSFNNIFSNCGYVMLGVLFLILVARRDFLYRKVVEKSAGRHALFGIPQHFGLFYAMGFALCMEGFMSGCYHVCPTVSNFQFDTSFMYIMACLCILKIYQNRHPDISANSHSSYMVMALIIIVAVLGVLYGSSVFWILFALVYMFISLVLSIHIYYMGRWQLDRHIFKRFWLLIRTDWMRCSRPSYCNRFVLLLIGNAVNWGIAIVAITIRLEDFASFLLGIFIINLLLYNVFYVASKILMEEKIAKLTVLFILMAIVSWGVALYFFVAHLTSWQLTPAVSREGNKDCILMGFYDAHDVWHFLSAISLFFSFLVLLTLDDEIIFTRRDQIPVF